MQQLRRSRYIYIAVEDTSEVDIESLLRGEVRIVAATQFFASTPASGEKAKLSLAELELLSGVSSQSWTPAAELATRSADGVDLQSLLQRGLLVVSGEGELKPGPAQARDQSLEANQWHPSAALFHFMERQEESDRSLEAPIDVAAMADAAESDATQFVQRHGPPPPAFHQRESTGERIELPLEEKTGALYDTLRERKTTRRFDTGRELSLRDLSSLLRYVFGCHGIAPLDEDVTLLHKTSPSGGSLHPIEAYPLVLNAESLAPGLYHYRADDHALEMLEPIPLEQAKKLAVDCCNAQLYAGDAHVLVILTARFFRNQWKYRNRARTHGVMLMDAGHLSQTFYLVATDLGLGAFYTGAINGPLIEERLGLVASEEGAIGICGCGVTTDRHGLGLKFQPFIPRET
ncbi:MAG: putative peptide maturation dehydrogenase [Acidobacteriota bacterium]